MVETREGHPLDSASKPRKKPKWLTKKWFDRCSQDETIQDRWIPQVDDWYLCRRHNTLRQIISLADYFTHRHGRCDIYVPHPYEVRKWNRKAKAR